MDGCTFLQDDVRLFEPLSNGLPTRPIAGRWSQQRIHVTQQSERIDVVGIHLEIVLLGSAMCTYRREPEYQISIDHRNRVPAPGKQDKG